MAYIKYEHHGINVSVRKDLKGKHREYCLCYDCRKFIPIELPYGKENCPIASLLFAVDKEHGITTPVWECKEFKKK